MAAYISSDTTNQNDYNGSKAAAWVTLLLLVLLLFSDFADRQMVVAMFPYLKPHWNLSDVELGFLTSIVSYMVAIFAIPIGFIADRWSQVKCAFIMSMIWGIATIACSFAKEYSHLLVLRGIVGIGEAGYSGVGIALLMNAFPTRLRARVLSIFNSFAALGSVFGVLIGGVLSQNYGWQFAFGAMGIPGIIVAIIFYFVVKDTKPEPLKESKAKDLSNSNFKTIVLHIFNRPSVISNFFATGVQYIVLSTIFVWIPSFFNRAYGLDPKNAAMLGAAVLLLTSISSIGWGYLCDKFGVSNPKNKLVVIMISCIFSFSFLSITFYLIPKGQLQYSMIFVCAVMISGTIGTPTASVIDVVNKGIIATAVSFGVFILNIIGFGSGPIISGYLSDKFGLETALAIIPIFSLLAALLYYISYRYYDKDLAKN